MGNVGDGGLLEKLWALVAPREASAEVVAGDPAGARLIKRMATGPVPSAWSEIYTAAHQRPERVTVYGEPHRIEGRLPVLPQAQAVYFPLSSLKTGREIYFAPQPPLLRRDMHPLQTLAHELTHFLSDVTGSQPFQGHREGEEAMAAWGEQRFRPREEWSEFPEAPMNLYIRMLQRLTRPAGR